VKYSISGNSIKMSDQIKGTEQEFLPQILIVDDIPENLQVLGNILNDNKIDFSYANSGQEALDSVSGSKPDLILLDVNMPGMDGYEVCDKLKLQIDTRDIPVIFLTARTDKKDLLEGFNRGAVDYITKPFDSGELIVRLRIHLELWRSRRIIEEQNRKLLGLNNELGEVVKTKNKFFSIIAHDLKDPISTLVGFSDLLLKTSGTRDEIETQEMITHINRIALHSLNLLENLLEWSRSQTGRIKYEPSLFNIAQMVDEVIDLHINTANNKAIQLKCNGPKDQEIFADRKMIHTVIRNLVSNALKFTCAGGTVNIRWKDSCNEFEFCISDTGVGIPAKTLGKLFILAENVSTNGTDNERGTGLGLLLCKEFVEKNGGRIWVRSEPGNGSEFYFSIPETK
jgi:two-component system sensor histidine kinase/response regulator